MRNIIIEDPNRPGQATHPQSGGLPWPGLAAALLLLVSNLGCTHEDGTDDSVRVVELTDANFQHKVLEANQPVLVEFWAPWCEPCLEMAPAMEQVSTEFSGRARVARIRIDENPATTSAYSVNAPPTVIVFRESEVLKRRHGRQSARELASLLTVALDNGDSKKGRVHE